jgi:16S rRNA (cytosine1402-N4)-methyltransferase
VGVYEMSHLSVLLRETVQPLIESHGQVFVDATLGGGGHSAYLLASKPNIRLYAFDRDMTMLERARTRFAVEIGEGRLILIHANYQDIREELAKYTVTGVDGIMADFGVSSFQIDLADRGFSFNKRGPLDMRMDQSAPLSAYEVVNEWTARDLEQIFWKYGEEKFGRKIAERIVQRRQEKPIADTLELATIVSECIPKHTQGKINPATRVFQAIRIAVNQEIAGIEKFLQTIPDFLNPGGVASIISFHSLEDRLVKERFKFLSAACICPPEVMTCERCQKPPGRLEQNKPIIPSEDEVKLNPRARSAKLRIFYKN